MKKVKLLFILISVLFSTGCSSVSKSGWQYFPDVATSFSIKIGEVNVTIDLDIFEPIKEDAIINDSINVAHAL